MHRAAAHSCVAAVPQASCRVPGASRGAGLYHMRGSSIETHVVQVDGADMGSLRQARPDYVGMRTDTVEDVKVMTMVMTRPKWPT